MSALAKKLRIGPGMTLLTLHAPEGFAEEFGQLPDGVKITASSPGPDQVHWFLMSRAQLEKELSRVLKMVKPGVTVWAYYPKGSSGVKTDLSRDKGWDCLLAEDDKLSWINLVSFNDTWSAFGFRAKTEADKIKASKGKPGREIFKWIDPVKKIVKLPEDLTRDLKGKKKETAFFNDLSFTNRKEYVEWIITAKRPETRETRVKETVVKLGKGWKNPRNL